MTDALAIAGRSAAVLALAEGLAADIIRNQFQQEERFVYLGKALLEIRTNSYWRNAGFTSFGKYIQHLSSIVRRERSTLYQYTATVERLLPVVGEDQLVAMGINKALVLGAGMKYTGKTPSPDLIAKAAGSATTTEELKSAVNQEFRIYVPTEQGVWRELGFYADDEEFEEIKQAIEAAKRADNVSNALAESYQIKRALLVLARDFMSGRGVDHAEV